MFIPEKLKLNRFKVVRIPKVRDMLAQFGMRVSPDSAFTGDEITDVVTDKAQECAITHKRLVVESQK